MDIKSFFAMIVIFILSACVLMMILSLSANKGAGFKKYFDMLRSERSERRASRKNKKR
ncbi:hypothetical protein [Enterococcus hulanensis]|uniref:hypothetical protein n=1 Tax=Enterococcus hulanensis TaxID=2559929 RepID=UPI0014857B4B|nr:hypothetical protein [Enterococcus hulanensis]